MTGSESKLEQKPLDVLKTNELPKWHRPEVSVITVDTTMAGGSGATDGAETGFY